MNKKIPVSIALALALIAMTVTFSVTWLLSMATFDQTVSAVTRLQAQYAKLAEIDNYVRGNFYGSIDDAYLFDRVALGYMNGLGDRYSTYYTQAEYAELTAIENGELVGIGIELLREATGTFRVVRVYADSPAAKAGIQKNAAIVSVNGVPAKNFSGVRALQSALLGRVGTDLSLVCLNGISDEVSYTVYRSTYTNPAVEYIKAGDYGFIRIYAFTPKTFADFDFALRQAQSDGVKGLLFDVRGCDTGYFRDCYDIIDLLAPLGTVAQSKNRLDVVSVLATSDKEFVDLPMAVLVNEGTAGPAELFAVSIRDLCGGQLVGGKTAGRGSIQGPPRRLSDGSAISLTIASMLTSRGESFDGVGLLPDVEISAEGVEESLLYDPSPLSDLQALRALEVLRALVRERGGEPGAAILAPRPISPSTGSEVSSNITSSQLSSSPVGEGEDDGGQGSQAATSQQAAQRGG